MSPPRWFSPSVSVGNVVTWAGLAVTGIYTVAVLTTDVRALQAFKDETRVELAEFRKQRQTDRDTLLEIKGDVRVILQIIERDRVRERAQPPASR